MCRPGDDHLVAAASHLFDGPAEPAATARFLADEGHHLLLAYEDDRAVGFVSGVEVTHPDKGTEMFLYELAVDEPFRRRGIGRALVQRLADIARGAGCYGMWVRHRPRQRRRPRHLRGIGGACPRPGQVVEVWTFVTPDGDPGRRHLGPGDRRAAVGAATTAVRPPPGRSR